jgi:hypothetical protein
LLYSIPTKLFIRGAFLPSDSGEFHSWEEMWEEFGQVSSRRQWRRRLEFF